MTRQEAISALRKGHKITHEYYSPDEWLMMIDGRLITEDGEDQGMFIDSFWTKQQPFEDGWETII